MTGKLFCFTEIQTDREREREREKKGTVLAVDIIMLTVCSLYMYLLIYMCSPQWFVMCHLHVCMCMYLTHIFIYTCN